MPQNVVIDFNANVEGLKPAYDALLKLGKISEDDVKSFEKANALQKELAATAAKSSSSYDKLASSTSNVKKNIVDGSINKAIEGTGKLIDKATASTKVYDNSIRGLKQQYKDLLSLAIQNGEHSPIGKQALKDAGELKDRIADLQQTTKNYGSDTATFDAIGQGIGTIGAGFQAAQGAQALFGEGNEDLQKSLLKLQAIMALTNGLQQIQNNLQKESALRLGISNVLTKVYTASTNAAAFVTKLFGASAETSSVGFKTLRGAIIGTGIGALVVLIGYLITNFDTVTGAVKRFAQSLGLIASSNEEALKKQIEFLNKTEEYLENAKQNALKIAASKGQSTLDLERKFGEEQLKLINGQLDAINKSREGKLITGQKVTRDLTEEEIKQIADLENQKVELYARSNDILFEQQQRGLQARKNQIDARLQYIQKGSKEELRLKLNQIEAERQIENSQRDLVGGQIELNNKKALAARKQLFEEYKSLEIQGAIDAQNIKLTSVQVGSKRELEIKRNVLDLENQLIANNSKLTQAQKELKIIENGKKELEIIKKYGEAEIALAEQIEKRKQDVGNTRLKKFTDDLEKEYEYYNTIADLEFQSSNQSYTRIENLRREKFNRSVALLDAELSKVEQTNENIRASEEKLQRDLENKATSDPANRKQYELAILESEERVKTAEQETADEIVRINREKNEKIIANDNEAEANKRANQIKQAETYQQLASETADFLLQINQLELQQNLERIDEETAANDKNFKKKIITEGEYNKRKQEIEDKINKEKIKAAKREKAIQSVMTIVNTATSIIKTGAEMGYPAAIPFQVLAGALGALQLAAINNAKIPEFAKGTNFAPKGWAWVGEQGPELVNLRGGEQIKTASQSKSFAQFEFGKEFFNSKTIAGSVDASPVLSPKGKEVTAMFQSEPGFALDYHLLSKMISQGVGSQLSKMPITNLNLDKNGFNLHVQNGSSTTKYLDNRYSTN